MKKYRVLAIMMVLLSTLTITGCEEDNQRGKDDVQLDPKNSINVEIKVTHENGFDIFATTKTIHDQFGGVIKVFTTYDTIPSLGLVRDTLETGREYEDDNGDMQSVDTIVTHPKDYQLYISVKK
jgi:hypothetical protein